MTDVVPKALAELIEQLTRALHRRTFAHGLNPAQWSALRYLARANPQACTVSRLAEAQGTARSTASQTVKVLIRERLIEASETRGRGQTMPLVLTRAGQEILARDPLQEVTEVLRGLPSEQLFATAQSIEKLIRAVYRGLESEVSSLDPDGI